MSSDEDTPVRSFVEALVEKYIKDETEELFVYSVRDVKMEVEFRGRDQALDRYAKLEKLEKVALRDLNIATAGNDGEVGKTAPSITELDLQGNKISQWSTVAKICKQLPKLSYLQLSRMNIGFTPGFDYSGAFDSVKTLVLNRGGGAIQEVFQLQQFMPALEELHFCYNGVKDLHGLDTNAMFPKLKILNLEGNEISTWEDVTPLGKLKNLERLILSDNKIPSVGPFTSDCGLFTALTSLSLNGNQIAEWKDVNMLRFLPNLSEIRFQKNPLLKNIGFSLARLLLIARLATLTHVNGSSVRVRERLDAEKLYIKKCMTERLQAEKENKPFDMQALHPRYAELIKVHGEPDPAKLSGGGGGGGLGDEIAALTLRAMAASAAHKASVPRKLPLSLQVGQLKMLCEKAFDIPRNKQVLSFRMPGKDGLPEPLDDDTRPLSFYAVRGGGDVLVNENDGTEDEAKKAEEERRQQLMQQQLREAEEQQDRAKQEVEAAKAAAVSSQK